MAGYQQITLSQILSLLQSRLDSYTFWSQAEQTDALNEGLRLYQLSCGRWKDRFVFDCVRNRTIYDLTKIPVLQNQSTNKTNILSVLRVVFGDGPQPLASSSFSDLDMNYPGWQSVNTLTPGAPDKPFIWAPFGGLNMVCIYPGDGAPTGTHQLQLDCTLTTPVLVNGADYVNLDVDEISCLVGYAAHVLSWKLGGIRLQELMPSYYAFLNMLASRNEHLKVLSPFKSVLGSDPSRTLMPRRANEVAFQPPKIGVR